MRVVVRLFASHREAVGQSQLECDIADGATVGDLARALGERYPALSIGLRSCRFAVNQEYVDVATPLRDGDRLVLIPPVAGGAPPRRCEVVDGPIDPREVMAKVAHPGAGAVVVFFGVVRDHALSGRPTQALYYEAYREMAEAKMAEIVEAIRQRWGLAEVAITHRVGHLALGEASVVIAVATPHRRAAFEACEFAIDTLKESVPIWKKEIGPDGAEWVE